MKRNLTLNEIYRLVMENDTMREEWSKECEENGLVWGSHFNRGCRIKGKKVGIQKFEREQSYIAARVYRKHTENANS